MEVVHRSGQCSANKLNWNCCGLTEQSTECPAFHCLSLTLPHTQWDGKENQKKNMELVHWDKSYLPGQKRKGKITVFIIVLCSQYYNYMYSYIHAYIYIYIYKASDAQSNCWAPTDRCAASPWAVAAPRPTLLSVIGFFSRDAIWDGVSLWPFGSAVLDLSPPCAFLQPPFW